MQDHKFKVGQSVRYVSSFRSGASGVFRIVNLLPSEGSEQQYRIKSPSEAHERVAKESQLVREM